jgi:hypothetical protein
MALVNKRHLVNSRAGERRHYGRFLFKKSVLPPE